ncbi:OLC1v1033789C1 [Oldenlandia corymbosa var. corymbosa]|uniref:OLC1v1033789C1 n=1 Tax=Oldenlandia corymbosa var. corymbosa TaxID=529605 RepID=A0AAV1CRY8_OLDCO|nr:OLC1v1033789C1 [Oldenlandia corymbosa var. corymbosa]
MAMEDNGGSKVSGIRQIVKLKEFINKWQNVTLGSKDINEQHDRDLDNDQSSVHSNQGGHGGISPAISRRLMRSSNMYCDSDEDSCPSPEPPHGVPKGYLAVYVGPELRRFIIPTSYLSDPLFKVLLEKVEEEFGFDHCGGLTIPCETETFKFLLKCMENHQREKHTNQDTSEGTAPPVDEE